MWKCKQCEANLLDRTDVCPNCDSKRQAVAEHADNQSNGLLWPWVAFSMAVAILIVSMYFTPGGSSGPATFGYIFQPLMLACATLATLLMGVLLVVSSVITLWRAEKGKSQSPGCLLALQSLLLMGNLLQFLLGFFGPRI